MLGYFSCVTAGYGTRFVEGHGWRRERWNKQCRAHCLATLTYPVIYGFLRLAAGISAAFFLNTLAPIVSVHMPSGPLPKPSLCKPAATLGWLAECHHVLRHLHPVEEVAPRTI